MVGWRREGALNKTCLLFAAFSAATSAEAAKEFSPRNIPQRKIRKDKFSKENISANTFTKYL